MSRKVRIKWDEANAVSGRIAGDGPTGVLLAHGAGAGQDHPWIAYVRAGLAAAGHRVLSFNYAYTEAERRSPDRPAKLLAVHRSAAEYLAARVDNVVLAGKSMGGRIGSHLAGDEEWPAVGLVYYGYPLVPMGNKPPRPTDHLDRIEVPQLFFAGTRDRLSPPGAIAEVVARLAQARLVVIDDGDHSFKVPKRAGLTNEEVLDDLVSTTASWIAQLKPQEGAK